MVGSIVITVIVSVTVVMIVIMIMIIIVIIVVISVIILCGLDLPFMRFLQGRSRSLLCRPEDPSRPFLTNSPHVDLTFRMQEPA